METTGCDEKKLTELMVGRPISLNIERPEMEKRETILKIVDLTVDKSDGGVALDDISLRLKQARFWALPVLPEAARKNSAKR